MTGGAEKIVEADYAEHALTIQSSLMHLETATFERKLESVSGRVRQTAAKG